MTYLILLLLLGFPKLLDPYQLNDWAPLKQIASTRLSISFSRDSIRINKTKEHGKGNKLAGNKKCLLGEGAESYPFYFLFLKIFVK
jgi:hypothetical protein